MHKDENKNYVTREEFDYLMKRFNLVEDYCMELAEAGKLKQEALDNFLKDVTNHPDKTCQ
jgi:hypothetical protein